MSSFFNRVFPFDKKRPEEPGTTPVPLRLPPGSRAAYPLQPFFTGREAVLSDLARMIIEEYSGPVVLCGPQGSGKTQLAVAFCSQYGSRFQGVHWMQSGPYADMETEIAACGISMEIRPWPENRAEQAAAAVKAWDAAPDRLLIIGDVEDLASLTPWLKKWEKLRILIISETAEETAGEDADTPKLYFYPVVGLSPAENGSLLRKIAPRLESSPDGILEQLANRLDNLPLAVILAGNHLKENVKVSPEALLGEIEKIAGAEAAQLPTWAKQFAAENAPHLAAALKVFVRSFIAKGDRVRAEQLIFLGAAFCAARIAIPMDLIGKITGENPGKTADFERGLRKLVQTSMLDWMGQEPAIHPLLAEIARQEAGTEQTAVLVRLADILADQKKSLPGPGQPDLFLPFLPHLAAVALHADQQGLKQAGTLWNLLGKYCWTVKQTQQAKIFFERGLAADEKNFGADDPNIATGSHLLGKALYETGNRKAASAYFLRAIAVAEKAYSPQHPDIAIYSADLGKLLMEQGDLKGARSSFERALSIHQAAFGFGPKHPETALDFNNLGGVLRSMGDLAGAKECFEKALAIDEWVYWVEAMQHPDVAITFNNLGRVLHASGDQAAAKKYFEQALAIEKKFFGEDHPSVATTLNNLGLVLHDTGGLAEARSCFEQALAIDEKTYGTEHSSVARDVNNLGSVLRDQNDLIGAKICFERALDINDNISGPLHADVGINANNLGRVLYSLGDLVKAKSCFERVLAIDEKIFGRERPEVASDVTNIGVILQDQGDLLTAKRYFERALAILEKAFPADHPKVQRARKSLDRLKKQIEDSSSKRNS